MIAKKKKKKNSRRQIQQGILKLTDKDKKHKNNWFKLAIAIEKHQEQQEAKIEILLTKFNHAIRQY